MAATFRLVVSYTMLGVALGPSDWTYSFSRDRDLSSGTHDDKGASVSGNGGGQGDGG